jgi:exopolysaccharide biosynthesis polyprenyl glycosylphosphotransferase
MKRAELIFNIVSIPVDVVSLFVAGMASLYIRIKLDPVIPVIALPTLEDYLALLAWVIPSMLIIFGFAGLYNLKGTRKFSKELMGIVGSITVALFAVILVFFFDQRLFPSRLVVLTAWALAIIFVVFGRFILKRIQTYLLSRGFGLHRLVIIADPAADMPLIEYIEKHPSTGYAIIAKLGHSADLLDNLGQLYHDEGLEEILHISNGASYEESAKVVQFARAKGLNYNYVPNLFDVQKNIVDTETIQGTPVIALKNTPLVGWGSVAKRIFDSITAFVSLLITLPVTLLIILAIKLDSKGPILYAAKRGGMGKDFTFYKFRSMYTHLSVGEEYGGEEAMKLRLELWKTSNLRGDDAPIPKIKDDPRVTKVGRFLRKSKLDEIPQFLNVLKGDMSMVGPRAHVLEELERYRDDHRRLFTIKPGIFGLSQLAQMDWPELPFEEEVRLNTFYIENWSIWLDIKILAKSFYYLFFKKREEPNT